MYMVLSNESIGQCKPCAFGVLDVKRRIKNRAAGAGQVVGGGVEDFVFG
jgi:hypothetical protein